MCWENFNYIEEKKFWKKNDLGIAHIISLLFIKFNILLIGSPCQFQSFFSCFVLLMISVFTITSIWADNRTLCGGGGVGQNGKPWNWLTAGLHFQIVSIARQEVSSLPICSFKLFTFSEELELLLWGDIQKESINKKHCQRHSGPGIDYFDSFNAISSKQKLQQALKSILRKPCINFDKFM